MTEQCPVCQGQGFTQMIACGPNGSRVTRRVCSTCDGKRKITPEALAEVQQRREEGKRIRQERRARGESMDDAANRLGMDIVAYSHLESGR